MALAYLLAALLGAVPTAAFRLPAFARASVILSALRLRRFAPPLRLTTRRRATFAVVAGVVLCVTFMAYVIAYDRAVGDVRSGTIAGRLPIQLFGMLPYVPATTSRGDELLLFIVLETIALGIFVANFDALGDRVRRALTVLVFAIMAYGALTAHSADSMDFYLYVGQATLGAQAYAPPAVPFHGDLAAVNMLWGTPLFPSAYGPVWIAFSHVLIAPLGTLAAKLYAFRVVGLVSVMVCALLARALGSPPYVVAAIACNPALYDAYVVNAHNDLFGVDLILGAMLAMRRDMGVLALVLAIAGSLTKLTLTPVAFLATVYDPSLVRRVGFAGIVVAVVVAVYAFGEGGALWHALSVASRVHANPKNPIDLAFHAIPALVALGTCFYAVATRRVRAQSAWSIPALGQFALVWYFAWSFPFALASSEVAAAFFVTLPIVFLMLSPLFPVSPLFVALRVVVIAGGAALVAYNVRKLRGSAAPGRYT